MDYGKAIKLHMLLSQSDVVEDLIKFLETHKDAGIRIVASHQQKDVSYCLDTETGEDNILLSCLNMMLFAIQDNIEADKFELPTYAKVDNGNKGEE